MIVETDLSYISTYIGYSDIPDQLYRYAQSIAKDRDETFSDLTIRRHQLTGNVNPAIVGEMNQHFGLEFWVRIDCAGFYGPECYQSNSILPYNGIGNRDGDYIDGINYSKKDINKVSTPEQYFLENPELFLRTNRHFRKRQRRIHEEQRSFYEEWVMASVE